MQRAVADECKTNVEKMKGGAATIIGPASPDGACDLVIGATRLTADVVADSTRLLSAHRLSDPATNTLANQLARAVGRAVALTVNPAQPVQPLDADQVHAPQLQAELQAALHRHVSGIALPSDALAIFRCYTTAIEAVVSKARTDLTDHVVAHLQARNGTAAPTPAQHATGWGAAAPAAPVALGPAAGGLPRLNLGGGSDDSDSDEFPAAPVAAAAPAAPLPAPLLFAGLGQPAAVIPDGGPAAIVAAAVTATVAVAVPAGAPADNGAPVPAGLTHGAAPGPTPAGPDTAVATTPAPDTAVNGEPSAVRRCPPRASAQRAHSARQLLLGKK